MLPFINLSGDLKQEYFADGIAEDIITGMSRYPSLFVIARNSSLRLQRSRRRCEAGRLRTGRALCGRRQSAKIRQSHPCHSATGRRRTGKHVWAERYDRELADFFAVQDDITVATTTAIAPAIAAAERQRAMRMPPGSLDGWAAYQRGLWHFYKISPEDNALAERYFHRAIDIDPNFAAGYKGLASAYIQAAGVHGTCTSPRRTIRPKRWLAGRLRTIPPMRRPIQPSPRRRCTRAAIMRGRLAEADKLTP